MLRRLKLFTLVFIVVAGESLVAQTNTSSPYSRFGIGDLIVQGVGRNQMMGGLGVSSSNALFINNVNPALLARTNNVIFNIGLGSSSKFLKTSTQGQNSTNINLDMVNMSFPISKRWTSGFGLRPFSNVDYDISTVQKLDDTTNVNLAYTGSGGISQFYFSNGVTVSRGLYLGLETSYLFGRIVNESESQLDFSSNGLDISKSVFADRTNFSDFTFKPGVAWRKEIKVSRDTVFGNLKSNNPKYVRFKERLDLCVDSLKNKTVNITEPQKSAINADTLGREERKIFLKEESKRILAETEKNNEIKLNYCKATLEDLDAKNKRKDSFYPGNKKFVKKDTMYIGNKLFAGKSIEKALRNTYEGEYLLLIANNTGVTVSSKIENLDEINRLKFFIQKIKDEKTAVIVKTEAAGKDLKLLANDLDVLMKKLTDDEAASENVNKSYIKQHIQKGSGIFFNLGSTYEFQTNVRASNLQVLERRQTDDELISSDTLNLVESGIVTLPSTIKFGFGLERPVPAGLDKFGKVHKAVWSFGCDLSYSQWSQYKSFSSGDQLNDSYRAVIGGEIIPDIEYKGKSPLPLIIYRGGLHYEKTPLQVNGVDITDFGINFGVSLPVYNKSNRYDMPRYLDIGFTFGQRGTIDNNLIRENYLRGTVNYTINNRWFQTYKRGL